MKLTHDSVSAKYRASLQRIKSTQNMYGKIGLGPQIK
jgi:hypothetical protein